MRKPIFAGCVVCLGLLSGCTPFEGDGSSTGTGAGGAGSQSSTSVTGSTSSASNSSSGAGGTGPMLETITVLDTASVPQAGLTVFSAPAKGTPIVTSTTDAMGQATLDIPAGGSVSLLDPDALRVTTYFGVGEGASVRFVRAPVRKNPNPLKTMQVTNPNSSASLIEYGQSCDAYVLAVTGNGVSSNYPVSGCPNEPAFDVVAVGIGPQALPGNIGPVVSVGTKLAVAYSGGTIGTIAQAATVVGSAQGVATIPGAALGSTFRVIGRRSGVRSYHREIATANGGLVQMPTTVFNGYDFEQTILFAPSGNSKRLLRHLEHAAQLPAVTMAITMPTPPSDPSVTGPAPDLAAGTLPFGLSGASADAIVLEVDQAAVVTWTVLTPAVASGSVTLPSLPSGFEALRPASTGVTFTIRHVDDLAPDFASILSAGWQFEDETLTEANLARTY